jgi:cell wall-associated NlpC family hydrolase
VYSYVNLNELEKSIAIKSKELKTVGKSIQSLKEKAKSYQQRLQLSENKLQNLQETQDSVLDFLVSVTDQNNIHILDSSVNWDEVKKQLSALPAGDRKNALLNSILLAWKDIPFTMGKESLSGGFDSPRFLRYVLKTVGLKINNVNGQRASDILMNKFQKVDKPMVGDLVFFKGQVGSFGFILLSIGDTDSEHVSIGTLQKSAPLQIISMGNINTQYFPLRGYFRVIYPDEKSPM